MEHGKASCLADVLCTNEEIMPQSSSHQYLLIGLPGAGKTSFLAALWFMVDQSDIDCDLQLQKLYGERQYLNKIRDAWLEYKSVPRNFSDSEVAVSMILKRRDTGAEVELNFPDLSGESFRLQWTERQYTKQYDMRLRKADGAMLFVHPDKIVKPIRIETVNALAGALDDDVVAKEPSSDNGLPVSIKPWDIETAPTQVQLVELLQFILSRDYFSPPFRLAVMVSAWDLVAKHYKSPREWLYKQMPLLAQFLDCNNESFTVVFYGISAQGGKYASPLFDLGHIKEPMVFARKILDGSNDLAKWLREQLGANIHVALAEALDKPELEILLVSSFNQLITTAEIYDRERFKSVSLRSETKELLNSTTLRGEERTELNRLLLEDAYFSDLSKERINGKEALRLQEKAIERRVTIISPDGNISHDITEPLQWFMR